MTTLTTRATDFSGFESISKKNSPLTQTEVDNNFIGLLQRIYDVLPVGTCLPFAASTAPSGWLAANGVTIGKSTSNASSKDDKYISLFKLLWNECLSNINALTAFNSSDVAINFSTDTTTADNAWTNNYYISLPDLREKSIIGKKTSSDISGNSFQSGGNLTTDISHTHANTLSLSTTGAHTHTVTGTTGASGSHAHTISSLSLNNSGNHSHAGSSADNHIHNITVTALNVPDGAGSNQAVLYPSAPPHQLVSDPNTATLSISPDGDHTHGLSAGSTDTVANHTHTLSATTASNGDHTHTVSGGITSSNQVISTLSPYISLTWIIKYSYGLI